jgi:hypothetical protein
MMKTFFDKAKAYGIVLLLLIMPICFVVTNADNVKSREDHRVLYFKLESPMLALVDGIFLGPDTIEYINSFKREILAIMLGDRQGTVRIGRYEFNGKRVSAQELGQIEEEELYRAKSTGSTPDEALMTSIQVVLKKMKTDCIRASDKLNAIARGSKPIFGAIIEESCHIRNRMESILLLWAKTPEELEEQIFAEKVLEVSDFTTFCTDLLNCLGDLLKSCPKALHQFEDRANKWRRFEKILKEVLGDECPSIDFFKYVKIKHLDTLTLKDITPQAVKKLWEDFSKKQLRKKAIL